MKSSIQKGGCTTPPTLRRALIGSDNVLHAAAALSPAGVIGIILGTMVVGDSDSASRTPIFGIVVIATALVLSLAALLRGGTRAHRHLALVGLAGNLLLLAFGLVRTTILGAR